MRYLLVVALLGCSSVSAPEDASAYRLVSAMCDGDAGGLSCPPGYSPVCIEHGFGAPEAHWDLSGAGCFVSYGDAHGSYYFGNQLLMQGNVMCDHGAATCGFGASWWLACVPDDPSIGCPP